MYQLIRDNIDPKEKEEESAFKRGGIRRKRIKRVYIRVWFSYVRENIREDWLV